MAVDCCIPVLFPQPVEVAARAFAAGQNDQIARWNGLTGTHPAHLDLGMQAQRIEVGVVTDARQHGYRDPQALHIFDHAGIAGQGVLCFQMQTLQVGQHAQHGFARLLGQPIQPRRQQTDITAEAIDNQSGNPCSLAGREQGQGAVQMGEYATPVDVAHQPHRAVRCLGEAHVSDVLVTQVNFRRAAGAFNEHHVISGTEPLIRCQHGLHGNRLVVMIAPGVHVGQCPPVDNDLRTDVSIGFEQHRVHIGMRFQEGCLGLHRLSAADFATVHSDCAVESHVLGFKGDHAHAAPRQQAA